MQDVLTAAIEFHRSGQLGQASQLYQKILAHEQENPEALHLWACSTISKVKTPVRSN